MKYWSQIAASRGAIVTWEHRARRKRQGFVALVAVLVVDLAGLGIAAAGTLPQGDPKLFKLAAVAHQANRDRIRTWRGKVAVQRHTDFGDGNHPAAPDLLKAGMKATVTFVVDRDKQRWRCLWLSEENSNITKKGETRTAGTCQGTMVKDGTIYECFFSPDLEKQLDKGKGRVVRQVRAGPASDASEGPTSFDPMVWFGNAGEDLDPLLLTYDRWFNEGQDLVHISVRRDGDLVIVEARQRNAKRGDTTLNRYVVDLSKGATLTEVVCSVTGEDGTERLARYQYEYENVKGIWVPKKVTEERRTPRIRLASEEYQWLENVVNEPVAEEEFAMVNLGARRFDRFVDLRTDAKYTIRGEEYPLPDNWVDPSDKWRRPWVFRVMVAGSVLLIGLLVAMMVARRRRKVPT